MSVWTAYDVIVLQDSVFTTFLYILLQIADWNRGVEPTISIRLVEWRIETTCCVKKPDKLNIIHYLTNTFLVTFATYVCLESRPHAYHFSNLIPPITDRQ